MTARKTTRRDSGQALVETLLVLPLLLTVVLNAINFGYFFLMAMNITASARSGGLYSIMGGATPAATALPPAGSATTISSVSYLAYQDLTGAVPTPSTSAGVQVCSPTVGVLNVGTTTQHSQCATFGSVGSFTAAAEPDPELNSDSSVPAFLLNRVDVAYSFSPPIPIMPFNIVILASPACSSAAGKVTCTFYRHTEMRAMN